MEFLRSLFCGSCESFWCNRFLWGTKLWGLAFWQEFLRERPHPQSYCSICQGLKWRGTQGVRTSRRCHFYRLYSSPNTKCLTLATWTALRFWRSCCQRVGVEQVGDSCPNSQSSQYNSREGKDCAVWALGRDHWSRCIRLLRSKAFSGRGKGVNSKFCWTLYQNKKIVSFPD